MKNSMPAWYWKGKDWESLCLIIISWKIILKSNKICFIKPKPHQKKDDVAQTYISIIPLCSSINSPKYCYFKGWEDCSDVLTHFYYIVSVCKSWKSWLFPSPWELQVINPALLFQHVVISSPLTLLRQNSFFFNFHSIVNLMG